MTVSTRVRRDRCPGTTRPWLAEDGALVRIRLVGGRLHTSQLTALSAVARRYGDGDLHLTARANVQLRALPAEGELLPDEVVEAIGEAGLLPSVAHDLVRNIMVSPLTGRRDGRADLRPVADQLDELIRADAELAGLPGRFLFVLDDGRGDVSGRECDLGLVVLDSGRAQLRVGDGFGAVVALADAPRAIVELARRFLGVRGVGPTAAWHVRELAGVLAPPSAPEPGATAASAPLAYDDEHVEAPHGVVDQELAARLTAVRGELVVTPWSGVLVPESSA
jgi:precorrin-3B synthase